MRKIILLELNEVPWFILQDFVKKNPSSAFATLLQKSQQYETYSEDSGHLSPWITWPSVHRGVNNEHHGIFDFGQHLTEIDKRFPPVWEILRQAGISSGVFGSLHSYPLPSNLENYCFYIPDSFALNSCCFPESVNPFQEFNLQMSRTSARNVSSQVDWKLALDVFQKRKKLGLKSATFFKIGKQLLSEKLNSARKCRRRTFQAVLSFDIFMKQISLTEPHFCTFFTNHVASAMHRYWAAAYPKDYENHHYDENWINTYQNEIEFAMHHADQMVRTLLNFIDQHPLYDLWVLSSMGQEAVDYVPLETQLYLVAPDLFMQKLGMSQGWTSVPCMLPQANFKVALEQVNYFRHQLLQIKIDDKPLAFREERDGFFSLDFGHANLKIDNVMVGENIFPLENIGLKNTFIEDQSTSSAYHIPEGLLIVYSSTKIPHKEVRKNISTLTIAPTILKHFGIEPPTYMQTFNVNVPDCVPVPE